jgi:serine protease AprX
LTLDELPPDEVVREFQGLVAGIEVPELPDDAVLWSVNLNRRGKWALWQSTKAVKADAARRLFNMSCKGLRWVVMDSGIDARHLAFRRRNEPQAGAAPTQFQEPFGADDKNQTRIVRTYDFTNLRRLLTPESKGPKRDEGGVIRFDRAARRRTADEGKLIKSVVQGAMLDWGRLAGLLEVPMTSKYVPPRHVHGTHVAGILAADWRLADGCWHDVDVIGMCPDLGG